jgi:polyisoprenoid-binding protein YceI
MKQLTAAAILLSTVALSASAPMPVERYSFDTSHTYVGFVVRHLGVSNVKGKFNKFDGEILLDDTDITKSSVRVTIDAASIDTENERRDNHLRSADFFEAAKFPNLTFVSKRVEKKGSQLQVTGDLTIRDVTREVTIPFALNGPLKSSNGQKRIGAEGSLVINRFDYGLKWNRMTEAVQVVAPEVRIELSVEATTPRPGAVD